MKKTIAKMMAATMLVASMPAMVLPTFTVNAQPGVGGSVLASSSVTVTELKFNGTYQNGKVLVDESLSTSTDKISNASSDLMIMGTAAGFEQTGTLGVWNTHIQYFTDNPATTTPSKKVGSTTLVPGKNSIKKVTADDYLNVQKELDNIGDYFDNTGVVKEIKVDSNAEVIITLDQTKLTDAKKKELAAGTNNTIEFTPWILWDSSVNNVKLNKKPVFEIQVGQTYTAKKTQIQNCSTPDNIIKNATVTVDESGQATLVKVSTDDKKVNMKGQKIDLSTIEVGGIEFPIVKFEEQALKSSKMTRLTAKNVKNLETGAVRGCKKIKKVNMGGAKMKRIHSKAFYDCKKLKNIKINVKGIKSVGREAFNKLKNNCTISLKVSGNKNFKDAVKKIKKSKTGKVRIKKA